MPPPVTSVCFTMPPRDQLAGDTNRRRRRRPLSRWHNHLVLTHAPERNSERPTPTQRLQLPPWTPPLPRPKRAANGANSSFSARGFLPGPGFARFASSPSWLFSRRTTSPPPSREPPAPLVRAGRASSPLIRKIEQRPTATMLVSETGASVVTTLSLFSVSIGCGWWWT